MQKAETVWNQRSQDSRSRPQLLQRSRSESEAWRLSSVAVMGWVLCLDPVSAKLLALGPAVRPRPVLCDPERDLQPSPAAEAPASQTTCPMTVESSHDFDGMIVGKRHAQGGT